MFKGFYWVPAVKIFFTQKCIGNHYSAQFIKWRSKTQFINFFRISLIQIFLWTSIGSKAGRHFLCSESGFLTAFNHELMLSPVRFYSFKINNLLKINERKKVVYGWMRCKEYNSNSGQHLTYSRNCKSNKNIHETVQKIYDKTIGSN